MPIRYIAIALFAAVLAAPVFAWADTPGAPVVEFAFDEGAGAVLHDTSGHDHHGTITGATWNQRNAAYGLRFDSGHYVDVGDTPECKGGGDFTIITWIYLDASPFPDDNTNWAILDCEQYRREGYIFRIDGGTAKAMFRSNQDGVEQYGFGTTLLENRRMYCVAAVRHDNECILYVDGRRDAAFAMQSPAAGNTPLKISSSSQSFQGEIFYVAYHPRAFSDNEMADAYWQGAARYDAGARRGGLRLTPHLYYAEQQAVAEVDFFGIMPLAPDERLMAGLFRQGGAAIDTRELDAVPVTSTNEFSFGLHGCEAGQYELRAELKSPRREAHSTAVFSYPWPPYVPPPPEQSAVDALPGEVQPPAFDVAIESGGGLALTTAGRVFHIESSFSIPRGGWNVLGADRVPGGWETRTAKHRVTAAGPGYRVSRRVRIEQDRVVVSDRVASTSKEAVGILIHHRLHAGAGDAPMVYVGGRPSSGTCAERSISRSPTLLLGYKDLGVGLVPADDVFIVQSRGGYDEQKRLDLSTNTFALEPGASYTLEWAIYLNGTGDYYDLANAIRRHEGRNGVRLDGALAFLQGTQQKRDPELIPDASYFERRNAAYATVFCLSWCADDPGVSLEGIEFTERPVERQRIRAMMERLEAVRPGIKGMFHVAHQLYATDTPGTLFPDSRVIDASGKQATYPYSYENGAYFSRERYDANWRWWIYYPTLENSFGQALLKSVDVMMDEMKCRGVFSDGFLWGYGGEYTYDRTDGHSADIDPDTHVIQRKKASVLLVSQDAMIAWCRKIWSKGGVVFANGVVPTRTICAQPLMTDKEVTEGPDVALLPTPATLGDPAQCKSEAGTYKDVLNKLRYGNLYFYYNEPSRLAYESLPKRMYPITVQEVHAGCVKGEERVVTMNSGVYGWAGSRDLHRVYRYDSRGHRIPHDFMTTVDNTSVRTRVALNPNESAVVERVPIRIESTERVNVVVRDTPGAEWILDMNGRGKIGIVMAGKRRQMFQLDGPREIRLPN